MRFLKGKIELDEAAKTALYEECLRSVRAGVRPTLSEWEALEPIEQEALLEAQSFHEKELAAWHGIAVSGEEGLSHVIAEMDGGQLQNHLLLEAATARAAQRMNTREFAVQNKK